MSWTEVQIEPVTTYSSVSTDATTTYSITRYLFYGSKQDLGLLNWDDLVLQNWDEI